MTSLDDKIRAFLFGAPKKPEWKHEDDGSYLEPLPMRGKDDEQEQLLMEMEEIRNDLHVRS